jgi:hypothetical protein
VRSGQSYSHLVEFTELGAPTLTWVLRDEEGTQVSTGTITLAAEALSVDILIPALANTLDVGALWGSRDLSWSYGTSHGEFRYGLEALIPFGASPAGVRTKLGLGPVDDLTDEEIPLLKAYLALAATVTLTGITDDLIKIRVRDAIEAQAGLELLPTLQVRVSQKESSGTNQFARADVDWDKLAENLQNLVLEAYVAINPAFSLNSSTSLLTLVTPDTDLFPGA